MEKVTLSDIFEGVYGNTSKEDRAKFLIGKIYDVEKELETSAGYAKNEAHKELSLYQRDILTRTRKHLATLSIEEWRQREAIKLFLAGRIDKAELRIVSETWHGGKQSD